MGCDVKTLDNHWHWLITLGCFINLALSIGMVRASALFYDEWMNYFEETSSTTSTLGMTIFLVHCLFASVATTLSNRYGCRPVVMIGGLLAALGYIISSFTPNVHVLFISYGVIMGVGFSLASNPMQPAVVGAFVKNPALGIGLATSGISAGGMVMPVLIQTIIEKYRWRGAFIIFSAMSLNMCVSGALVRPNLISRKVEDRRKRDGIKASLYRIFTNSPLVMFYLSSFFHGGAIYTTFLHLKSAMIQLGDVTETSASFGISFVNIGNFLAVILLSIVMHKHSKIGPVTVCLTVFTAFGIFSVVFPFTLTFLPMATLCGLLGAAASPTSAVALLVIRKFVNLDVPSDFDLAFGIWVSTVGTGAICGSFSGGYLYDVTKDYRNTFFMSGVAIFIGNAFLLKACICKPKPKNVKTSAKELEQLHDSDNICDSSPDSPREIEGYVESKDV